MTRCDLNGRSTYYWQYDILGNPRVSSFLPLAYPTTELDRDLIDTGSYELQFYVRQTIYENTL